MNNSKCILAVDRDEIIAKLDSMYPSWILDFASPNILRDWLRYNQIPDAVKIRVITELWPICQATYAALYEKNKR